MSFYELLQVEKTADYETIKKQFLRLAHKYHPDKQPNTSEHFIKIQQAWETLRDQKLREEYDKQLQSLFFH